MNSADTGAIPTLDLDFVRAQFPAFADADTGQWAHLENAGGSYAPSQVIDKLTSLYSTQKVQPYWDFDPSKRAGNAMDRSYERMAASVNADSSHGITLGPSTTQNMYVLAQALRAEMNPGDEVIVTNQDHEANIGCWRRLAETGIEVKEWSVDPATGLLDLADLQAVLTERTKVLAVTHASNVAATINPIQEISAMVHNVGGRVVVDGVSYAPHGAIDVQALGCDFYAYSLYKTYGPHLGLLWWDPKHGDTLSNQGHYFNEEHVHYRLNPAGPDHAAIGAAGGIVDYYDAVHEHHFGAPGDAGVTKRTQQVFELFAAHEEALVEPLVDLLVGKDGVHLVGTQSAKHADRAPTLAFHSDKTASPAIYQALIDAKVSCGHGHFYAHRLVTALGLDPADGVVRISMVHYNSPDEVARAAEVLDTVL